MKFLLLGVVFLGILVTAAVGQSEERGPNELMLWGGFSPQSSTFIHGFGQTEDARFGIVALRYSRRINDSSKHVLKYTTDFVPAAFLKYPDVEITGGTPPSTRPVRPTRYAFGGSPVGFQVSFRPRKKVQPFVGISGGLLFFSKTTPNYVGTRLAFTADIGGGVEFAMKDKRAFSIGYKYYHISNAGRGLQNPGFDNNVVYFGYTFLSK